jgi:hypothetical protein
MDGQNYQYGVFDINDNAYPWLSLMGQQNAQALTVHSTAYLPPETYICDSYEVLYPPCGPNGSASILPSRLPPLFLRGGRSTK